MWPACQQKLINQPVRVQLFSPGCHLYGINLNVVAQQKGKTLLLFLLFLASASQAQVVINAMVADSASLRPLTDVNIKIKNSVRGTTTSQSGYFVINTSETDTLVFTRVGYYTKEYPSAKLKETMIVYLAEELLLLKPVTITGTILIPGFD